MQEITLVLKNPPNIHMGRRVLGPYQITISMKFSISNTNLISSQTLEMGPKGNRNRYQEIQIWKRHKAYQILLGQYIGTSPLRECPQAGDKEGQEVGS